jgi:hypothetical protein
MDGGIASAEVCAVKPAVVVVVVGEKVSEDAEGPLATAQPQTEVQLLWGQKYVRAEEERSSLGRGN